MEAMVFDVSSWIGKASLFQTLTFAGVALAIIGLVILVVAYTGKTGLSLTAKTGGLAGAGVLLGIVLFAAGTIGGNANKSAAVDAVNDAFGIVSEEKILESVMFKMEHPASTVAVDVSIQAADGTVTDYERVHLNLTDGSLRMEPRGDAVPQK